MPLGCDLCDPTRGPVLPSICDEGKGIGSGPVTLAIRWTKKKIQNPLMHIQIQLYLILSSYGLNYSKWVTVMTLVHQWQAR